MMTCEMPSEEIDRYKKDGKFNVEIVDAINIFYLAHNTQKAPMTDANLRMAIKRGHFENVAEQLKILHDGVRGLRTELDLRNDSVAGRLYVDMRTYAAARLLALNRRKTVRTWLKQWVQGAKKQRISAFDKRLLDKLIV